MHRGAQSTVTLRALLVRLLPTQGCGAALCLDPATHLALGSGRVVVTGVWAALSGGEGPQRCGHRPASGGGVQGHIGPFSGVPAGGISGGHCDQGSGIPLRVFDDPLRSGRCSRAERRATLPRVTVRYTVDGKRFYGAEVLTCDSFGAPLKRT